MKTQNLIAFILLTGQSFIMNGTFTVSAQTEWTKYSGNPVLTKSDSLYDWDMFVAGDPCVIKDADTLKMWYTGTGPIVADTEIDTTATIKPRIGYAYSFDGIHWAKYSGNPVVVPTSGEWDSLAIETVTVLKDTTAPGDERYRMWYGGSGDLVHGLYQIGYAYSPDGIHWTKHSNNPVLTTGPDSSWDNGSPEGPSVIMDNDTLKMWYAGLDTIANGQPTDFKVNIGYAWSLDGVNWTKHPDNPVIKTGGWGSWDYVTVQDVEVIKIEGIYHLWYTGFPEWLEDGNIPGMSQIGYAYSGDGIHWTKDADNPVVRKGAPGTWDAGVTLAPAVILDDDTLRMWYTGINVAPLPEWPEPFTWAIGYATSTFLPTNITEAGGDLPVTFGLVQNYPNPFNPATTIRYEIPYSVFVTLIIYDLTGRKIYTMIEKQQTAGQHSSLWHGVDDQSRPVSSGLYLVRLQAGNFVDVEKVLLIK